MANVVVTFAADVRKFLRGTKDVERATGDIASELDSASRDADKFERQFTDAMKDSQRAAQKSTRSIGRDFDNLGDEAREAGREVGDEFRQNLGESLASGNVEDIAADTLGGLVSGLKGGFGLIAAAGAGIAVALYNGIRAEAEKQKEQLAEAFGFVDLLTGEIDRLGKITAGIEELGGGDVAQGWKDAAKYAAELGISVEDVAAVVSGEITPDTNRTLAYLASQEAAYDKMAQDGTRLTSEQRKTREAIRETLATARLNRDATREATAAVASARTAYKELGLAAAPLADDLERAAEIARNFPDIDVRGMITWYNQGPGAAYIDPSSANYSPGHVAIANEYVRQARQREGTG